MPGPAPRRETCEGSHEAFRWHHPVTSPPLRSSPAPQARASPSVHPIRSARRDGDDGREESGAAGCQGGLAAGAWKGEGRSFAHPFLGHRLRGLPRNTGKTTGRTTCSQPASAPVEDMRVPSAARRLVTNYSSASKTPPRQPATSPPASRNPTRCSSSACATSSRHMAAWLNSQTLPASIEKPSTEPSPTTETPGSPALV